MRLPRSMCARKDWRTGGSAIAYRHYIPPEDDTLSRYLKYVENNMTVS